jgi:hypothetical protein
LVWRAYAYIGYELHLAVQARDVRWTNQVDRTTLDPEMVPLSGTPLLGVFTKLADVHVHTFD